MTNEEILSNLNDKTKAYIDEVFSYIDFFSKKYIELDENKRKNFSPIYEEFEIEDFIGYAFLISTLKNDEVLSKTFEKYGITVEKIYKMFNIPFEDIEIKKAEDTFYVTNNTLESMFSEIACRIKENNHMNNKDLLLSELQPYQIFDCILENYYLPISDLLYNMGLKNDDDILRDIGKVVYDQDCDFAKEHGIDLEKEEEKSLETLVEFDYPDLKIIFVDGELFIKFKEGIDFDKVVSSGTYTSKEENDVKFRKENVIGLLETDKTYKITKIAGFTDFNEDLLNKVLKAEPSLNQITMALTDTQKDGVSFILTLNSSKAFANEINIAEENKKMVRDIMKMSLLDKRDERPSYQEPTPYLDKYCFDLTKDRYLKDPCVGREQKIRELEKILLYPEKDKSMIVVGSSGCGKTALIKGLAYQVQRGQVPDALKNLRIFSVDCSTLVAGTKYVGTLEEKMRNILADASSSKDIILFMDEIHQALGAGKSEGNDNSVSEILKPYLDYGRARVIGATTDYEYDDYVAHDPAFKTRFKRVNLKEPDEDLVYQIVENLILSYNKFSDAKLLVSDEERDMIIKWLLKFTQERCRNKLDYCGNPRLVLDIVKDAYAIAALNNRTEVSYDDLEEAISQEERLWPSSREDATKALKHLTPKKTINNIIQFKLVKK